MVVMSLFKHDHFTFIIYILTVCTDILFPHPAPCNLADRFCGGLDQIPGCKVQLPSGQSTEELTERANKLNTTSLCSGYRRTRLPAYQGKGDRKLGRKLL